jgi:hypothetical protein
VTDDHWAIIGIVTFLMPLLISFLCVAILRFTLDRRVRRHLPSDKIYDCWLDAYFGLGRAVMFGYACAWPRMSNSPNVRPYYNDMDIKQFANRFETVVGYIMTYCVATSAVSIIILTVLEWLGVYNLD